MRLFAISLLSLLIGTESFAATDAATAAAASDATPPVVSAKKKRRKAAAVIKAAPAATTAAGEADKPAAAPVAAPVKEPLCEVAFTIDNVRKSGDQYRGQICYTVFRGKDGFPDKSDRAYTNKCVPVQQSSTVTFDLKELPCNQDYGVALLHDENMNRQLDKNLAIPKEGIGMSNNPSFIRVNSPSYDEVKFMVQAPHSAQKIRIHYF